MKLLNHLKNFWIDVPLRNGKKLEYVGFRNHFNLESVPETAIMYLCGGSFYRLWINGELVLHGPCQTSSKAEYVDAVQISSYLVAGTNIICIENWLIDIDEKALSRFCERDYYKHGFACVCDEIESLANPSQPSWRRNYWNAHSQNAPRARGSLSEIVNCAELDPDWQLPGFNDSGWEEVEFNKEGCPELRLRPFPYDKIKYDYPDRVYDMGRLSLLKPIDEFSEDELNWDARQSSNTGSVEDLDRVQIRKVAEFLTGGDHGMSNVGSILQREEKNSCTISGKRNVVPYLTVEMPCMVGGYVEIDVTLPADTRLDVNILELMRTDDGGSDQTGNRIMKGGRQGGFTLIGDGRRIRFQSYLYWGIRYICLVARNLEEDAVIEIHRVCVSRLPSLPDCPTSHVTTSDPILNKVIDASIRTQQVTAGPLHGDSAAEWVVTGGDCIRVLEADRIFFGERGNLISRTTLDLFLDYIGDVPGWPKVTKGRICGVRSKDKDFFWHLAMAAHVIEVLRHFKATGESIPEEHLDLLNGILETVHGALNVEGLLEAPENSYNWYDWSRGAFGNRFDPPGVNIGVNCFYYRAFRDLHEAEGTSLAKETADRMREGIQGLCHSILDSTGPRVGRFVPDLFIRREGQLTPYGDRNIWCFGDQDRGHVTEVTQYWLLWSGILDESRQHRLWEVLSEWQTHGISTKDSTRINNLSRADLTVGLWPRFEYIRDRRDGSLLYQNMRETFQHMMLREGTIWEVLTEDTRCPAHVTPTYAGTILYEALTGIKPGQEGGYKECTIEPLIDNSIQWARGYRQCEQGTIGVSWQNHRDQFILNVSLPEDHVAIVRIPSKAAKLMARGGHPSRSEWTVRVEYSTRFTYSVHSGESIERINGI